ncbi:MAG: flagellar assembly peptidoglycan hydrolase FlgJ [Pseudomonadota bacterium]
MNPVSSDLPSFYYDLQSLAPLKQAASKNPSDIENLRSVAEQFESMFMQMVLKSMRAASIGEGLFDSKQSLFYRDMLDQQLSVKMANNGGMGLADLLVEQLSRDSLVSQRRDPFAQSNQSNALPLPQRATNFTTLSSQHDSSAAIPQAAALRNAPIYPQEVPANSINKSIETIDSVTLNKTVNEVTAQAPVQSTSNGLWERPEDFVRDIWPHAVDAARELGVDPRVLVAQSALETGWGLKVPRHPDGSSSFNLFGIKAGSNWQGETVSINTLEFEQDAFVRQRSSFRAYDSIEASMRDYVDFLKTRARYAGALEQAADPEKYTRALQDAGYATDPIYADKILRVMQSKPMEQGLASLSGDIDNA